MTVRLDLSLVSRAMNSGDIGPSDPARVTHGEPELRGLRATCRPRTPGMKRAAYVTFFSAIRDILVIQRARSGPARKGKISGAFSFVE